MNATSGTLDQETQLTYFGNENIIVAEDRIPSRSATRAGTICQPIQQTTIEVCHLHGTPRGLYPWAAPKIWPLRAHSAQ